MEFSNGVISLAVASILQAPITITTTPPMPPSMIITNPTLTGNPNTSVSLGASANNALD